MKALDSRGQQRRLYWLASYPKSGNTWVRMFLNAYITGFPPDFSSAFQYVMTDLFQPWYQATTTIPLPDLNPIMSLYLRPAVLVNLTSLGPARDSVLKTHHANVTFDDIPIIPPKLTRGAIYIVRDPRSVLPSFAAHMGTTMATAVGMMNNDEQIISPPDYRGTFHVLMSWSNHVISWLEETRFPVTVVKYEDMKADPEKMFTRILTGLGIENIDKDRMKKAIDDTSFEKLKAQEEKAGFVENKHTAEMAALERALLELETFDGQLQEDVDVRLLMAEQNRAFFRKGNTHSWQDEVPVELARTVERDHRRAMEKLGYELCYQELSEV